MLYALVLIFGVGGNPVASNTIHDLEQTVCTEELKNINYRLSGKVLYSKCIPQGTQNIIILSSDEQQKKLDNMMKNSGK